MLWTWLKTNKMLAPRNRRRLTGRTNLKQMEEQETKASLERKRQAKQREKEKRKGSRPRDSDEEVVDKLVGDLKERFYERGSLAKTFLQLDKDYSGSISVDEFSTFFKNLGHSLTPSQVELLLFGENLDTVQKVKFSTANNSRGGPCTGMDGHYQVT